MTAYPGDPEMTDIILSMTALCSLPVLAAAQGLDPAGSAQAACRIAGRAYSGDYSGHALQPPDADQPVERQKPDAGLGRQGHRRAGRRRAADVAADAAAAAARRSSSAAKARPTWPAAATPTSAASILEVNGILYFSTPDNAWAIDARDGHELWHYFWKTKGGTHIGNRGLGMWGNWLFMETPDDYLVSLDARTGKERWHKAIADFNQQYFSTMAPIVVGNHVLVGTGNDLDAPGFLQSFDPETGELQWKCTPCR